MPLLPPDRRAKTAPKQGTTVSTFMRRKVNKVVSRYLTRRFLTYPVPHTTLVTAARRMHDSLDSPKFVTREGKPLSEYEAWRKIRAYKNAVIRRIANLVIDNYHDVLSKMPNSPPPRLVVKYSSESELGVYAGEDIDKGRLVGFYCGTYHPIKADEEIPTASEGEEYILMLSGGYIDGDPWKFTHGPCSRGFVASLINCARGTKCNCRFSVNRRDRAPERMQAVKVVTTKRVRKGAQLFIDYGGHYFDGKAQLEVGGDAS